MTFKPSPRNRQPAKGMEPVIDPAGWTAVDLGANDDWVYELSDVEINDVREAVAAVERRGMDILDIRAEDFPLPHFDRGLAELRDEIHEGRGFNLIRGIPIADFTKAQAGIAFWGIGTRFGHMLSQNAKGHMLGHVKDFGADYEKINIRGYQTSAEMNFHSDQCDYVALMCIHPAKQGGASRIASSVTLYNEMLKTHPELVKELVEEFYLTKHGETRPGEAPWYKTPVFSFQDGYLTVRGIGIRITKAQGLPGVPPFTEAQKAAIKVFRETARKIYFDMDFRPGDIQIVHNHVMLHTRTAFEDWPEPERKRHLMRLWITPEEGDGRPVIPGYRENFQDIGVEGTVQSAPVDDLEPV
jgi:hypothetical protein